MMRRIASLVAMALVMALCASTNPLVSSAHAGTDNSTDVVVQTQPDFYEVWSGTEADAIWVDDNDPSYQARPSDFVVSTIKTVKLPDGTRLFLKNETIHLRLAVGHRGDVTSAYKLRNRDTGAESEWTTFALEVHTAKPITYKQTRRGTMTLRNRNPLKIYCDWGSNNLPAPDGHVWLKPHKSATVRVKHARSYLLCYYEYPRPFQRWSATVNKFDRLRLKV